MNYIFSPFVTMSFMVLISSTLMAMSSANWLFLWAAMEINMLSFIPVMLYSKHNQETEGAVKYFLAQALGSALMLMSSTALWSPYSIMSNMMLYILLMSALLKLGSVPCHFWYPSVMASISWISCLTLSTWQKLAPLSILIFLIIQKSNTFIMAVAALNALVGGMMGMNQSQMRTIMAYSSIGHIGWMISLFIVNKPLASMFYFMIYSALITPLFLMMQMYQVTTTKQMSSTCSYSMVSQMTIIMLLMSLGGLPPLTGFMPKLMTLYLLFSSNQIVAAMLIMGSLMNLYFYLNIAISMMMAPATKPENLDSTPLMNNYSLSTATATLSLGLTPFIMFF